MASSSASSTHTNHSVNSRASRFSTLKVFKFQTKDKSKPPPLPPKDPYYLNNRSLASLVPDSAPNSPLYTNPNFTCAESSANTMNPNPSSISLVSSVTSAKSSQPSDANHLQVREKKSMSFFKFGKRSPKSPSLKTSPSSIEDVPPPPTPDDNISMPWNFQHNIHVDEGYTGLPPSWMTSLLEAGFSEEEIVAIQARRAAGTLAPISNERPNSPQAMSSRVPYAHVTAPIIRRPSRTSSLPRHLAPGQRPLSPQRPPPPLPTSTPSSPPTQNRPPLPRVPPPLTRSYSSHEQESQSLYARSTSSLSMSGDSHQPPASVHSEVNGAVSGSYSERPTTPPRRNFRVANGPIVNSPPPAYSHTTFHSNGYIPDQKSWSNHSNSHYNDPQEVEMDSAPVASTPSHRSTPSAGSKGSSLSHQAPQVPEQEDRSAAVRRTGGAPPRLSLHKSRESVDLESWSASLFSAIPSGLSTVSENGTVNMSAFATAQRAPSTSERRSERAESPPQSPVFASSPEPMSPPEPPALTTPRTIAPTRNLTLTSTTSRPIPGIVLQGEYDDDAPPSSSWSETTVRYGGPSKWEDAPPTATPLWSELEGILRNDPRESKRYTAALTETYSPTIPVSPERGIYNNNNNDYSDEGRDFMPSPHRDDFDDSRLSVDLVNLRPRGGTNRDSNRSSSSTLSTSTITALTAPTIVRNVSIARRAGAFVINKTPTTATATRLTSQQPSPPSPTGSIGSAPTTPATATSAAGAGASMPPPSPSSPRPPRSPVANGRHHPPSPLSSHFGSEEGSGSGSSSSQDHQTPITEADGDSPLNYYLSPSPGPDKTFSPKAQGFSPTTSEHRLSAISEAPSSPSRREQQPRQKSQQQRRYTVDEADEDEGAEEGQYAYVNPPPQRPKIVISDDPEPSPSSANTPKMNPGTPLQRYRGWLSEVVAPLEEFIDEPIDPREFYIDLREVAEGESGSVYAAKLLVVSTQTIGRLKLPPLVKAKNIDDAENGRETFVAIKNVPILPDGSPKLQDLEKELKILRGLWHEHILGIDAMYVDLVEDSLWIRMELMERSLADVLAMVDEGLVLHERMMARFASDILLALEYLRSHNIAHRDVRSDNVLLNSEGMLKLADFSSAVQVQPHNPIRSDQAGVIYWQAPEIRGANYNALKVDAWSLGATVWEMAEAQPPFAATGQVAARWPSLSHPELYSRAFHDFLKLCSEPEASRPDPAQLLKHSLVNNACGRAVIVQVLARCFEIERAQFEQEGIVDQGPDSD
ncbi:hypothetical protein BDN72DRAFT_431782 [Pluteus cervinus]|uniref:Uncharacterized protein n=1 Tax=Pluteus cervinus TaxID=181527 RepID=A0ACD3B0B4_9AGAR|nr:hypothetical protein BDN72DRAFT_431782 [Pluteus cervinus]